MCSDVSYINRANGSTFERSIKFMYASCVKMLLIACEIYMRSGIQVCLNIKFKPEGKSLISSTKTLKSRIETLIWDIFLSNFEDIKNFSKNLQSDYESWKYDPFSPNLVELEQRSSEFDSDINKSDVYRILCVNEINKQLLMNNASDSYNDILIDHKPNHKYIDIIETGEK